MLENYIFFWEDLIPGAVVGKHYKYIVRANKISFSLKFAIRTLVAHFVELVIFTGLLLSVLFFVQPTYVIVEISRHNINIV